jgi:hypothetical protein
MASGEDAAAGREQDAPQDVQQNGAGDAAQPQQKPAVKRYRRAELDEEEDKNLLEAGEDE